MYYIVLACVTRYIFREKEHLLWLFMSIFKYLDCLTPRVLLVIIYFTKIEDLTLNNTVCTCPLVFDYIPVPMTLAIFESFVASKKHDGGIITERTEEKKRVGLHYTGFWRVLGPFKNMDPLFTGTYTFENLKIF